MDIKQKYKSAAEFIVKSAEATVKEAEDNLRFTTVRAPISGIVSKLDVELGERVVGTAQMTGTEMLRIADLTKMEARVDVNENDIIRVNIGDTANIDVDSYSHTGKLFKGVVTNIANTANDKTSPDAVTEFEVRRLCGYLDRFILGFTVKIKSQIMVDIHMLCDLSYPLLRICGHGRHSAGIFGNAMQCCFEVGCFLERCTGFIGFDASPKDDVITHIFAVKSVENFFLWDRFGDQQLFL